MWLLAALALAVVVLVLAIPWRVAFRLGTDPGVIDLRLAPFDGVLGEVRLPRRKPRQPAPAAQDRPADPRRGPVLCALPQFLSEVARQVHLDRVRVALRFGTGDPALTGQIYGQLMPLVHGGLLPRAAEVTLWPVFDRACLSGDAEVVLRVTPLRLVFPLLRLARAGRGRT